METLKLQTNVPETIALKFADGLPVESRFGGDQILFTLTNGQRFYAAPFVAKKIADAGIVAGELFEICKRETVAGNRRSVDYQIRTDVGGAAASVAPVAPNAGNTSRSVEHNAAVSAAARVAPAGAAVHPAPALPAAENSASAAMAAAGRLAIDAVLEIEEYAQSRGMTDFAFGADNIQKILVSLYIDSRKGGR